MLGLMLYCCYLEILNNSEEGAPRFYFALDLTNYVASPDMGFVFNGVTHSVPHWVRDNQAGFPPTRQKKNAEAPMEQ